MCSVQYCTYNIKKTGVASSFPSKRPILHLSYPLKNWEPGPHEETKLRSFDHRRRPVGSKCYERMKRLWNMKWKWNECTMNKTIEMKGKFWYSTNIYIYIVQYKYASDFCVIMKQYLIRKTAHTSTVRAWLPCKVANNKVVRNTPQSKDMQSSVKR